MSDDSRTEKELRIEIKGCGLGLNAATKVGGKLVGYFQSFSLGDADLFCQAIAKLQAQAKRGRSYASVGPNIGHVMNIKNGTASSPGYGVTDKAEIATAEPAGDVYKWPVKASQTKIGELYKVDEQVSKRIDILGRDRDSLWFLGLDDSLAGTCSDDGNEIILSSINPLICTVGELEMYERCKVGSKEYTRIPTRQSGIALIADDAEMIICSPHYPCERVLKSADKDGE